MTDDTDTELNRRRLLQFAAASATIGQSTTVTAGQDSDDPPPREHVKNTEEWSEVVHILANFQNCANVCTGVLISDFHVLTAGHCVYDQIGDACDDAPAQGEAEIDNVLPALNDIAPKKGYTGTYYPYDQAKVTDIRIHSLSKQEKKQDVRQANDIALLTLDRSIGTDAGAGSRSIFCADEDASNDCTDDPEHGMFEKAVRLIGYPEDEPDETMWLAPGKGLGTHHPWDEEEEEPLMHRFHAEGDDGMSGGPVVNDDGDIVSVYSGGVGPRESETTPHGVWFNDNRYQWLQQKIQDDREELQEDRGERLPDDMPVPSFDKEKWDPDANTEMVLKVDGTPLGEQEDRCSNVDGEPLTADDAEITPGTTLKVKHTVRNVGPVDDGWLQIDFIVEKMSAEVSDVVEETVTVYRDIFDMPAPYDTEPVCWEYEFGEEADGEYQVRMRISEGEEGEKIDPDLETRVDPCFESESPFRVNVASRDKSDAAWPMSGHNPARTRAPPSATGPSGEPDVAWTATGRGGSMSAPIIAGDTVYAADEAGLHAFNASKGTEPKGWPADEVANPYPLAMAGDLVYVAGGENDVYAVDATSGEVLERDNWPFERPDDFLSAAVVGNTLYISGGTRLFAVDAETGELLDRDIWPVKVSTERTLGLGVVGDTLFVSCEDTNVYAVNAETGTEQWAFTEAPGQPNMPAIANDTVYVNYGDPDGATGATPENYLYAIDGEDGNERWHFEEAPGWTNPTVADDTVYVGDWTGTLHALDAADGAEQWRFEPSFDPPGEYHVVGHQTAVAGDTLYLSSGTEDDNVYAVDATTERERGGWPVTVPGWTRLSAGEDRLYVASRDEGPLKAFE